MAGFRTIAEADAFALRRKNRDFEEGDYEAVWDEAKAELTAEDNKRWGFDDSEPSERRITERCYDILVNGRD